MALTAIQEKALEAISRPDVRRLDRMQSFPAWLASRVALMKDEQQRSTVDGKYRTIPTLPANLTLSQAQRAEVERYVAASESLRDQTPANADRWKKNVFSAVTKLMLVLPAPQQDDVGSEVTGEAFLVALDDVPYWAVDAAIRKFYRHECGLNGRGQPFDYHWRPAPAELRRIALDAMEPFNLQIATLRKLLAAEPLNEFSTEHCERMQGQLRELVKACKLILPRPMDNSCGYECAGRKDDGGAHRSAYRGTQPRKNPA